LLLSGFEPSGFSPSIMQMQSLCLIFFRISETAAAFVPDTVLNSAFVSNVLNIAPQYRLFDFIPVY
jgi:hypothetical protein